MGLVFKNNAKTTLSSGVNDSTTTIPVTEGSVFPAVSASNATFFFATLDDDTNNEIVKVTESSGNAGNQNLTVVRAQESTSARAFSSGDKVELRMTAGVVDTFNLSGNAITLSSNKMGFGDSTPEVSLDLGSRTDSLHVPVGTTAQRPGSPEAGYLRYNSTTGRFEGYLGSTWGSFGSSNTFFTNIFAGDGSDTTFTLSQTIDNENDLLVFVDGVFQAQNVYSVSGTTLTFATAPADGRVITVYSVKAGVSGSNYTLSTMTGDGSDTTLTLNTDPVNENNVQVYIDGVYQNKDTFSVSGTTLTFSEAPPNNTKVEAIVATQTTINTATQLLDADGDTKVMVEESSDEDKIRFDTGGTERMVIDDAGKVGIGAAATLGALHVTSSLTDIVTFENTDAGTTGAQLILYHNSSSPADGDRVGALNFKGQDDAGNDATYAGIRCLATDVSNTTEDGTLTFSTTQAGTFTEQLRLSNLGNLHLSGGSDRRIQLGSGGDGANTVGNNTVHIRGDGADMKLMTASGGGYLFESNGSELMRINNSGDVAIGSATDGTRLYVYDNSAGNYLGIFYHDGNDNDRYGIRILAGDDSATTGQFWIRFDDGDGHAQGYIYHNGGTVEINQASDERLKENIVDSTLEGINTLKNIKQREFNWKRDADKTKVIGYIAQELESVYPVAVVTNTDKSGEGIVAPEDDPDNPYKYLAKERLIDVLIKATQEQQVIIEDLKARIETLEGS